MKSLHSQTLLILTIFLLSLLMVPSTTWSANYYVATNGNDRNPGTVDQPLLTIAAGVSRLSPGDTLLIRGGIYIEPALDDRIKSGSSWSAPVTIQSAPGEVVVFQPDARHVPGINIRRAKRFIRIDGISIDMLRSADTDGVKIHENSSDVELLNLEIKNVNGKRGSAIVVGDGSQRVTVRASKVYDVSQSPPAKPGNHGIYWRGSSGLIEWNRFYNIQGYGIQLYSTRGRGLDNNIVRYNIFDSVGQPSLNAEGAIAIYSGMRNKIYGNLIYNSHGVGITVRNNENEIYNNTIYRSKKTGIEVLSGTKNLVENNILFGNGEDLKITPTSTVSSYNLTEDPFFVDPAVGNFRPKPGSPAIGKGKSITEVELDLDRVPRPQGFPYDIGAYQHVVR